MTRRSDLKATVALAAVSVLVVIAVPGAHLIRTVFAVLLLLILPGYSLMVALFPDNPLDWTQRLLLTFGLGLSVPILLALVLNLTNELSFGGLREWTWTLGLLIVICTGCAIASERRQRAPIAAASPAVTIRWIRRGDLGILLIALAIFGAAVAFARAPLAAKNALGYSAVWLLPGTQRQTNAVRVGVTSGEQHDTTYRLVLRIGEKIVFSRRLHNLAPGENFATVVKLHGSRPSRVTLVASLYLADRPGSVYREATLSLPRRTSR
jgi:uncharacterized membrane protein